MSRRSSLFAAILGAVLVTGAASEASAKVLIQVDKQAQQMTVSVDGAVRWVWPVSTGRTGYATPSGNYRAFRMERDHFSKEWDDAPMPHSIFFTPQGHAIHGSLDTRRLGSAASHGCVRLAPANAAKLYELVESVGVTNAQVMLIGTAPTALARRPARAIDPDDEYAAQPGYPRYGQTYPAQQPYQYRQPTQPTYQDQYGRPMYTDQYGRPTYRDPYAQPAPPRPATIFPFFN